MYKQRKDNYFFKSYSIMFDSFFFNFYVSIKMFLENNDYIKILGNL